LSFGNVLNIIILVNGQILKSKVRSIVKIKTPLRAFDDLPIPEKTKIWQFDGRFNIFLEAAGSGIAD